MPFLVGQLVYTSFPKAGFKTLASRQVPLEVEQAFLHDIVYRYWDAYNPPPGGYRSAYLYQVAGDRALFGWLYDRERDDLGRSHVPYFIAYYLTGELTSEILEKIWHYLETGPIALVNPHNSPKHLETIALPDLPDPQPSHPGVQIPHAIREQSDRQLQEGDLLNISVSPPQPSRLSDSTPSRSAQIQQILQEFIARPLDVRGVVLVSEEGQPLVPPLGTNANCVLTIADTILSLIKHIQYELIWQNVDILSLRSPEGYLVLAKCDREVFLLVQTGQVLSGFLEAEIQQIVAKLQIFLQDSPDAILEPATLNQLSQAEVFSDIDEFFDELDEDAIFEGEDEVTYRGRRPNLS